MKRVVLWAIGIVVAAIVLTAGAGLLMPRDHVASVAIDLQAGPGQVWAIVTDFGGTSRWRPEVTAVRMQAEPGAPLRFTETSSEGDVTFELVRQDPPREQVVRVVDDDQPFGGTWTWELEPRGTGTRLTITERGFVKNPVFRVIAAIAFSPTDSLESYLRALAAELGESAEPVLRSGGETVAEAPRVD